MLSKLNFIFSIKDKVKLLLLMIIVIGGSFLELMAVSIFSPFINVIMDPEKLHENAIIAYFYQLFDVRSIEYFLAIVAAGIIVIYVVKNIYVIAEKNAIYRFSYRIQRNIESLYAGALYFSLKQEYFCPSKEYAGRYRSVY